MTQGDLYIICYDENNTRVSKALVDDYMDGRAEVNLYLATHPECDCILERIIYSSKKSEKWDYSE